MLPLLFVLTVGMMEFGMYWQQSHTMNEAARSGARIGSTLAREANYATDVVDAVTDVVEDGFWSGTADYLTIYKADPETAEPFSGTVKTCMDDCMRFLWDPATESFLDDGANGWAALDQAACGIEGHNDYIGVYVEGTWSSATGIFGDDRTLTEKSLLRLEPVPLSTTCEPTT